MPLAAIVLVGMPRSARAHSLSVDAFVEPGHAVTIEAYYGDGKPVAAAAVRVRNEGGQEIQAGQTDAQGRFRFQPPAAGPLTVEVVQAGHKGTARIEKDALSDVGGSGGSVPSQPAASSGPMATATPVAQRRAGENPVIPAIAGIALILSMASLWRTRSLSREIEQLRKQLESQSDVRHR